MNLLIVTLQMFCIPGMGQVSAFHVLESVSAWSRSGFNDVRSFPLAASFPSTGFLVARVASLKTRSPTANSLGQTLRL